MVEVRYPTRSHLGPIEAAIRAVDDDFVRPLHIDLIPGGYDREAHICITDADTDTFDTDWESAHPSRFSARIRAAACVLREHGYRGRFKARHHNGLLILQRAEPPRDPFSTFSCSS